MLRFFCLSSICVFLLNPVFAQSWEMGGFLGSSAYMGDLNPVTPYKVKDISLGGQLKWNIDPYWSIKLGFMHGKIQAADSLSKNEHFKERNLSFYSPVDEVSLQLEFNFFNYIPSVSKKRYSPYLFTGIGTVIFNPKTKLNGDEYELNLYGTEGQDIQNPYKTYALSVPFGAGVKYNITGKWNLIGEIGYRTAFTDYLDDVSNIYPNYSTLINPTAVALSDRSASHIGITGTQRGDFRKRDTYMFVGFSLTYTFLSDKCYNF
ncbi:DUF6089 family protein [Rubrolithibacter danxiaensis]|uniref:type IX secretion system protein PorG n=1 Tax=Rubrolithibacter danxiaensis TaxID=3390805 RepID=UPI003BF8AB51